MVNEVSRPGGNKRNGGRRASIKVLQIKLTASDLDLLRTIAKREHLPCSTWARRMLLQHATMGECSSQMGQAPGARK